ncbi:hypothetical protein A3C87_03210 [Candidatus Kaiserbacteria bacterium RIFCSPHIGHO2_02_FULL_49_34]|uniref:Glycosyltransferase GT-D fold domain-containing protein n=1 Tax=Candidatus Kaiserbacteria bacterium RIFCSPHIGHO2_02_FULL_49_34 TaxID=1798491 RepID=A0A1F6DI61_9BACT|nr:MAG: hypothetical protein A3C87_03210 [Candidatus Kaiserbacteria bacterium RIFCSPHIGHO2_02_FULL_49_34]
MQNLLNHVRTITPLAIRKKVGPILGYLAYWYRTRIRGPVWEPRVLSISETIQKIREQNLSVIRFGDGELSLIEHSNLGFQKYDTVLANRLSEILRVEEENLMICVPSIFDRIEHLTPIAFWFEIHHLFRHGHTWRKFLIPGRTYGDAFMTRPYLTFKNKRDTGTLYTALKALWENTDVVLIEGTQSRLGVGNDLFADCTSVKRILCPPENAHASHEAILHEANKVGKEKLILLSLGPAAKLLAYDLFKQGYRVIDIGHVDMEYEMFLRNTDRIVPVRYKYFNEINERNPEECADPVYTSQIIATIL